MDISGIVSKKVPCLDTVRALHQTVIALRSALEKSKSEILELRSKELSKDVEESRDVKNADWLTGDFIGHNKNNNKPDNIENLKDPENIYNLSTSQETERDQSPSNISESKNAETLEATVAADGNESNSDNLAQSPLLQGKERSKKPHLRKLETKISIKTTSLNSEKLSKSFESLIVINAPAKLKRSRKHKEFKVTKTVSFPDLDREDRTESKFTMNNKETASNSSKPVNQYLQQSPSSPNNLDQDQEVDDIELIFTTDDMKESDLKEHLVSIDADESAVETSRLLHCPMSDLDQMEISDRELDDDVFKDDCDESVNYKRGSLQMCGSKSDNSINNEEKSLRSCCSYQDSSFENKSMDKDESFDRFDDRIKIVETDISKCGIQDPDYIGFRRNTCPNPLQYRPLLHREALSRDSKGFSTKKCRPILVHSNAMRKESGVQTDISAIPSGSWKSESCLANKARIGENFTTLPSKFPIPGSKLRLSEKTVEARRVLLSDIGFTSMVPELSRSADHLCPGALQPPKVTSYGQFLHTPDLYSPGYLMNTSQRFTWTTATATPSEGSHSHYSSMYPLSPVAASRRCSAPVSPSRRASAVRQPSRVRFANGSLPELRGDWTLTVDSGDSTDSLVEEAECYIRRSIDCIVGKEFAFASSETGRKGVHRRASAPESSSDNVPPSGWQPFLPRVPRDLKPDHWVKVIAPEGRVRGGRVRYLGPIQTQTETFIGVQLSTPDGNTDGMYGTRRYFQCEPYHGIFIPFRKVIMGWRP